MALNCKAGDLAIVVKSSSGNLGKVVRCLCLASKEDLLKAGYRGNDAVWVVDRPLPWMNRKGITIAQVPFAPDANLRPIRDSDGEDEMIRIAGLPLKEHA